jgi:protein-S-isoprenylcysteine O-methyltransferase Ste14
VELRALSVEALGEVDVRGPFQAATDPPSHDAGMRRAPVPSSAVSMVAAFAATLAAEIVLGVLLVWSIARPDARIWPPPDRHSWQYLLVWLLIDVATLGILAVGVLDWNGFVLDHWLRLPVGAALALGGGGFALWGIRHLSWHASLGLQAEFVRSGPYRYTRNPQYVGDIVMLVGWGIVFNSLWAWILCALGIAWFAMAPWAEEPWLREQYGEPYDRYRRDVPRFLRVGSG